MEEVTGTRSTPEGYDEGDDDGVQVEVVKRDMEPILANKVIDIVFSALEVYRPCRAGHFKDPSNSELAGCIKRYCDALLGPVWYVVVGSGFSASSHYQPHRMIHVRVGRRTFFVFKGAAGNPCARFHVSRPKSEGNR